LLLAALSVPSATVTPASLYAATGAMGTRTMCDRDAGVCKQGNLVLGQVHGMNRHQRCIDQAETLQSFDRAFAAALQLILDFLRRFVQMYLDLSV
jgi:hypothetical protein